jgi:hypothetical protein
MYKEGPCPPPDPADLAIAWTHDSQNHLRGLEAELDAARLHAQAACDRVKHLEGLLSLVVSARQMFDQYHMHLEKVAQELQQRNGLGNSIGTLRAEMNQAVAANQLGGVLRGR